MTRKLRPVCRSCGTQLVPWHKDDPSYHWEWCRRKTLRKPAAEPTPSKVPDLRGVPWGQQPPSEDNVQEFSSSI